MSEPTRAEKLMQIQTKLKAPKSQFNNFGKYKYRNCEDILEAVKPLLLETGTALILTDDVVEIGGRHYVKATGTLYDADGVVGTCKAFAREPEDKKGMDLAQVTGATSSYARKYALNGLFCIDDTKDADSQTPEQKVPEKKAPPPPMKRIITFDGFVKQEKLPAKLVTAFLEEKAMTDNSTLEVMQEKALSKPQSFVTAFNKWFEDRKAAEESQDDTPPAIQEMN